MVEQFPFKEWVEGSSPSSLIKKPEVKTSGFLFAKKIFVRKIFPSEKWRIAGYYLLTSIIAPVRSFVFRALSVTIAIFLGESKVCAFSKGKFFFLNGVFAL